MLNNRIIIRTPNGKFGCYSKETKDFELIGLDEVNLNKLLTYTFQLLRFEVDGQLVQAQMQWPEAWNTALAEIKAHHGSELADKRNLEGCAPLIPVDLLGEYERQITEKKNRTWTGAGKTLKTSELKVGDCVALPGTHFHTIENIEKFTAHNKTLNNDPQKYVRIQFVGRTRGHYWMGLLNGDEVWELDS